MLLNENQKCNQGGEIKERKGEREIIENYDFFSQAI